MSDRDTIESRIRQQTPAIKVCDNGDCQRWRAGDPAYEAWVAATVDEHVAADAVIAAEADRQQRRTQARTLMSALEQGTATSRQVQGVLAFLLRREMS